MTTRFDRAEALRRLDAEEFDVLVVGGGVTGAAIALDAATRGMRTALVERHDFGSGTSSRSSKLVHGGIRYLEQFDVGLVWQALRERRNLLRNAPHLVTVQPFVIPILTKGGVIPRIVARGFGLVLWFYDLVGGAIGRLRHRRLDKAQTLAHMPTLAAGPVDHSYLYYDARVDDARLVLAMARTAADHGAAVANYAALTAVHKDASGRTVGATVDAGDGTVEVRAGVVVNAGGVWVDHIDGMDVPVDSPTIRPARGVHIVVPRALLRNDAGVILPIPGRKGSVFAIPWDEQFSYVGTTDTDFGGSLDDPYCTGGEIEYLLANLNHNLTAPVTADQVVGSWAGLRPLLKGAAPKTADLSRKHRLTRSPSGVVSIAGGKLTTTRAMAEQTVDMALQVLGRTARCRTRSLPLHGAPGYDRVDDRGLGVVLRDHLVGRFGADAAAVLDLIVGDRDLGRPVVAGLPYVRAEVRFAVDHEMARTIGDVLDRRTRARLLARDASADAAGAVADLMADALGWSTAEQARQVERYLSSVAEERAALAATFPQVSSARAVAGGWVPGVRLPRRLRDHDRRDDDRGPFSSAPDSRGTAPRRKKRSFLGGMSEFGD